MSFADSFGFDGHGVPPSLRRKPACQDGFVLLAHSDIFGRDAPNRIGGDPNIRCGKTA
jgi:hypothetical protein